jgi:hypothetical protein
MRRQLPTRPEGAQGEEPIELPPRIRRHQTAKDDVIADSQTRPVEITVISQAGARLS